jgi:monothiol glutaredoxin
MEMPDIKERIERELKDNKVVLFMKGMPEAPQCGFSAKVVMLLDHLEVDYKAIDILPEPELRQGIKDFAQWPTIPQLYIKGEFVGGCDIIVEMVQTGELKTALEA